MGISKDNAKVRRRVCTLIGDEILREMRDKENYKKTYTYDEAIFNRGKDWFHEGMSLEEAPKEIRENPNFVNGYQFAVRKDKINKTLEISGAEWYFSGHTLEEAHSGYLNSEYFVKGYNDAKNNNKRR